MSARQDAFAGTARQCLRPGGLDLTRRGLALCALPERARIADIGCGAGASVRMLREQGYCCVGLDLCAQSGTFTQVRARAEALPFARESLHGIVCECLLSLLQEPRRILKNFEEVCRPGGCLLLSDIYRKTSGQLSNTAQGLNACSPFSRQELESFLYDAGWRLIRFEDCSSALKDFAAQLLWHARGEERSWPQAAGNGNIPWSACGYGLWVAQKRKYNASAAV